MRLGRSLSSRDSSTGALGGGRRLRVCTGPFARTHVSLLSPPGSSESTNRSAGPPTRESAPGMTW